jgi:hypothetical protein
MFEFRGDFLEQVEHDLPPVTWSDADGIRRIGESRRRQTRKIRLAGGLIVALLVLVVATTWRPNHGTPEPIRPPQHVQLSPDLCQNPDLITQVHLDNHPCAATSGPGPYLDAVHGLHLATAFGVTLPPGWSFASLGASGLGSQVDLVRNDHTQGIRLSVYVQPVTQRHNLSIPSRAELLNALRRAPGLIVSPVTRLTIGGEPALQVDLTSGPQLAPPNADCSPGVSCYALLRPTPFAGQPQTTAITVGAIPGATSRLIFPLGHDGIRPTIIWIWDTNPSADFPTDLQRAQPILDSLDFHPPDVGRAHQ